MFRNYLTVAIRNLLRHKVYTIVSISGLAVGMTCFILIFMYVGNEWRYDQFHENSGRIYRIVRKTQTGNDDLTFTPGTSGALARSILRNFPEVQNSTHLWHRYVPVLVGYEENSFYQNICLVDPHFLEFFTFPLINGNRKTALQMPNSIVITQSMARRYFGQDDSIGRVLMIEDRVFGGEYVVTGVLKDLPDNSSIQFDFITSTVDERYNRIWYGWGGWRPVQTYVLLHKGTQAAELERKFPDFIERYMGKQARASNTYYMQPLGRVHLYSNSDYGNIRSLVESGLTGYGDIRRIYMLIATASLILAIACINFMNLSTARFANRAKEVCVRKALGASHRQLIHQYLCESVIMSLIALLISTHLISLVLPQFRTYTGKEFSFSIETGVPVAFCLLGFALVVGLLAGSYPAFFFSSFQPSQTPKETALIGSRTIWLRKGLIIFQFSISILLIISTAVIRDQLTYIGNRELGFSKDNLVIMPIFGVDWNKRKNPEDRLTRRYEVVKREFLDHHEILKATAFRYTLGPLGGGALRTVYPEGATDREWRMRVQEADADFLEVFEIELIDGRNFSDDIVSDATGAFILNESAVRQLGWRNAVGRGFGYADWKGIVIGVVKDFHSSSLHEKIGPLAIQMKTDLVWNLGLKIRTENATETIAYLREKWKEFLPEHPFRFSFADEMLNTLYNRERRFSQMSHLLTIIAIFVACLGLFGLTAYLAEQRTKEIGIRKVLGASELNIMSLLSREFMQLVAIANLFAWPVAYIAMSGWLQNFAYHIDLTPYRFIQGGILAFVAALLTLGFQSFRTARANPIDALRYE